MKLYTLWLKIREIFYYLGQKIEISEWTERWDFIQINVLQFLERMIFYENLWIEIDNRLPCNLTDAEKALEEHTHVHDEIAQICDEVCKELEPFADKEVRSKTKQSKFKKSHILNNKKI